MQRTTGAKNTIITSIKPLLLLAALRLEQKYPDITGASQSLNKTIQETAQKNPGLSISALFKYGFDLIMVLALGAAVISLIVAGIQYATNYNSKQNLKAARSRVVKSLLGIAILVCSYLILQIALPNLKAPQIVKQYVASEIIFFTKEGYADLHNPAKVKTINRQAIDELVSEGKARYFASQWNDAEAYLGELTKPLGKPVNFSDWPIVFIGLMGSGADNIKVLTWAGQDFKGERIDYFSKGAFKANGAVVNANVETIGISTILHLLPVQSFSTEVEYLTQNQQGQPIVQKAVISHPPLSMQATGIGQGVYLYAASGDPIKSGQRYLQASQSNFADPGFDFDNATAEIEIRNNNKANEKTNNLMAILFSNSRYTGNFRIFFEKQKDIPFPVIYRKDALKTTWNKTINLKLDVKNNRSYFDNGIFVSEQKELGNIIPQDPAKVVGNKVDIAKIDQFGKIEGASSIMVFNLAAINSGACKEVRLCNQLDLQGYCLSFTPNGETKYIYNSISLPMPWFAPVSIPEELITADNDYLETPGAKYKLFDAPNKYFSDNIRSLGIDGKCAVALFENPVDNLAGCIVSMQSNKPDPKKCWNNGEPGEKSQFFSYNDMSGILGKMPYLNLERLPIGSCTKREWLIKLKTVPCASSIAVFPIK